MLTKALYALLFSLSLAFYLLSAFVNGQCWHLLKIDWYSQQCVFFIWCNIQTNFSLNSKTSPLHDPQLHQKYIILALIRGFIFLTARKFTCLNVVWYLVVLLPRKTLSVHVSETWWKLPYLYTFLVMYINPSFPFWQNFPLHQSARWSNKLFHFCMHSLRNTFHIWHWSLENGESHLPSPIKSKGKFWSPSKMLSRRTGYKHVFFPFLDLKIKSMTEKQFICDFHYLTYSG